MTQPSTTYDNSLVIDAMIRGRKAKVLIDSGYLENFLLSAFARMAGFIKEKKKKNYIFYVFNDKSVRENKGQIIE
jgi:hypothetical protein